jgi:hypothetical protein
VLHGAVEELVTHRELRNKYETNRDIKVWSFYFLLKAFTTANKIQNWRRQLQVILPFVQMSEKTFYNYLKKLTAAGLCTLDDQDIYPVSWQNAAKVLDIVYCGTYTIEFNPIKHGKKQAFQYLIRREEIAINQKSQQGGLMHGIDENPQWKNDMVTHMVKAGADGQRLQSDSSYFQQQLLNLQMMLFRSGSAIFPIAMKHRADINRSVNCIQKYHCYKSPQSVSYMKRRMAELGIIKVEKICVESKKRARLYVPDGDSQREGYKWNALHKSTLWFLTDQIHFTNETSSKNTGQNSALNAA